MGECRGKQGHINILSLPSLLTLTFHGPLGVSGSNVPSQLNIVRCVISVNGQGRHKIPEGSTPVLRTCVTTG